ncbi:MAG TPA: ACT domain-containing protein [Vicinamibacteria bacterium]|nr:ACT domain-containing protein [Vicinamibacteria bacterium]
MTTEFKVTLANKPGSLARLATALGDADVNIEAIQGTSGVEETVIQFVTDDAEDAASALRRAGFAHAQRDVVIVKVLDEPGMLGDVALVMSEAGINIDSVYVTTKGHVVLGVDDVPGAIQVAGGMAVIAPS